MAEKKQPVDFPLAKKHATLLKRLLLNSPIRGDYKSIKKELPVFEETEEILNEGLKQFEDEDS